jgi:hypothetical protein
MVPDKQPTGASKPKEKARQASLTDAPEEKIDAIDRLVAQAFDSDPKVRLRVAQELGKIDDPRAIFALIELSSDKEEAVKNAAQVGLGQRKEEQEEIVSLGKLLSERKVVQQAPAASPPPEVRQNMMPTIERLFAHVEPKKRDAVRRKLLPSLQKLFGFSAEELDPLKGIDKITPQVSSAPVQVEMVEKPKEEPQNAANFPFGKHAEPQRAEKEDLVSIDEEDREVVGGEAGESEEAHEAEEYAVRHRHLFDLAYKLATTPGMGKSELKREQNRMVTGFKKEVEAAFKLASLKASEEGLATFSGLKPGMKKLSFAALPIASISDIAYGPKKKPYARISLWDQKKEVAVLVPRERAAGISAADKIALKRVSCDFLVETNQVVLVVGSKSELVVIK